jgi:hypothetical protein
MKGWIRIALKRMKAAKNCNHTVGIYHHYADTDLVLESEMTVFHKKRHLEYYVGDIAFFDYCPDCGVRLSYKERYKDAVEVVQMP